MNKAEIRSMQVDDVEEVYLIGVTIPDFRVGDIDTEEEFWSKEALERWVESEDPTLVAESAGSIVGFVLVAYHSPTKKAVIENIWVNSEYRNQGIAKSLLDKVETILQEQDCQYVQLLTKRANKRAQDFFEQNGYHLGQDCVWVDKLF